MSLTSCTVSGSSAGMSDVVSSTSSEGSSGLYESANCLESIPVIFSSAGIYSRTFSTFLFCRSTLFFASLALSFSSGVDFLLSITFSYFSAFDSNA